MRQVAANIDHFQFSLQMEKMFWNVRSHRESHLIDVTEHPSVERVNKPRS